MKLLHITTDNKLRTINMEKLGFPNIDDFVKKKLGCSFIDIAYANQKTKVQFCVLYDTDAVRMSKPLNKFATLFLNQGQLVYGDAFVCVEIQTYLSYELEPCCDHLIRFLKNGFKSITESDLKILDSYVKTLCI